MRNLTLAIEEEVLEAARKLAVEQGTSVNQLVRDYLADLVTGKDQSRAAAAASLKSAMLSELVEIGPRTWTREDLYER